MGLRPMVEPSFLDAMRNIVHLLPDGGFKLDLQFFRHHREDDAAYQWTEGSPEFGDLFSPALERAVGTAPAADGATRGSSSRYRSLSAGDVRGGVFSPSSQTCKSAPD